MDDSVAVLQQSEKKKYNRNGITHPNHPTPPNTHTRSPFQCIAHGASRKWNNQLGDKFAQNETTPSASDQSTPCITGFEKHIKKDEIHHR
jgi:hypothetical protein